ncbi:MAG: ThuA domain-containing protein [Planctomycetota bacterium]|nr:ThuA domain-containing protein [Planctomycetota bacterium]
MAEQPLAVFVVGTHHYSPQLTMPPLARQLEQVGFRCKVILPEGDPEKKQTGIGDLSALREADVAVFFLRFLTLPPDQLKELQNYVESGKPVVGFRTSTHAFDYPAESPQAAWNNGFGKRVLGSQYAVHLQGETSVDFVEDSKAHPALVNFPKFDALAAPGTLYISTPPSDAQILLTGTGNSRKTGEVTNRFGKHILKATMTSPIAWTWENEWGGRVFTTTLGHAKSFENPLLVQFYLNGIQWAAGKNVDADFQAKGFQINLPRKKK